MIANGTHKHVHVKRRVLTAIAKLEHRKADWDSGMWRAMKWNSSSERNIKQCAIGTMITATHSNFNIFIIIWTRTQHKVQDYKCAEAGCQANFGATVEQTVEGER